MRTIRWSCLFFALLVVVVRPSLAQSGGKTAPVTVRVPDGGAVPDAVLDSKGMLHLAYGKGMDAFYAQSKDGGKTFSPPVRLNRRPETVTVGRERGPKLALGKDGAIQVVWQGHYQKGGGIFVTRSTDGGKTFAPERDVLDTKTGIDEPTITADTAGNVFVLWLDGRTPEDPENKVASPLFMARSTDNGATFSPNVALKTDFAGRGCSCCMLWGRIVGEELVIAFRTGYRDIRDMYLLRGSKKGNQFHASRISVDNWKLDGCPMSGPRFDVGKTNAPLAVAWMSKEKVYWTQALDTRGEKFESRRLFPDGGDGNFPMIVQNGRGQLLLLWTRAGEAHWAIYPQSPSPNTPPVASGIAGKTDHRPFAFVGPDGGFRVIL